MNVEPHRRRGAQAEPASAEFLAGLVRLGLSEEVLAQFREGWIQSHGERRANIGAVFLHTEAQILEDDEAEELAAEGRRRGHRLREPRAPVDDPATAGPGPSGPGGALLGSPGRARPR
jgi:hypothetical protein